MPPRESIRQSYTATGAVVFTSTFPVGLDVTPTGDRDDVVRRRPKGRDEEEGGGGRS